MIHPSYSELIEAINTNSEDDDTTMSLNSRYSLVLAASKRARHLKDGVDALFLCVIDKAAGVHHNGLCFSFIIYDLEPVTCKKSKHFFGIYKVLVTA